eukprot:983488-Lingulodinium_polyedra.AAC.1
MACPPAVVGAARPFARPVFLPAPPPLRWPAHVWPAPAPLLLAAARAWTQPLATPDNLVVGAKPDRPW